MNKKTLSFSGNAAQMGFVSTFTMYWTLRARFPNEFVHTNRLLTVFPWSHRFNKA